MARSIRRQAASSWDARSTFAESGGFGVQLTSNIDIIASVEHNSHATFCTHIDPGITDVGVRVGYKF